MFRLQKVAVVCIAVLLCASCVAMADTPRRSMRKTEDDDEWEWVPGEWEEDSAFDVGAHDKEDKDYEYEYYDPEEERQKKLEVYIYVHIYFFCMTLYCMYCVRV
jgi:hypothetical protein